MAGLGRDAGQQTMVERGRDWRRAARQPRRSRAKPSSTHRHLLHPRGEDRAGDGREFAAADPAQHFQRILQMARHASASAASTTSALRASSPRRRPSRARPSRRRCRRTERAEDRRRNGGIADAEIAEAQQIGAAGNRLHAEGHGGGAAALVERGVLGDVGGRQMQRQVEDLQAEIVGDADLVDRRTAGRAKLDRPLRSPRPGAARCRAGPRRDCRQRSPPAAGCTAGGARPVQAASQAAMSSMRPSEPFGLSALANSVAHRAAAASSSRRQVRQQVAKIVEGQARWSWVPSARQMTAAA